LRVPLSSFPFFHLILSLELIREAQLKGIIEKVTEMLRNLKERRRLQPVGMAGLA